MSYATPAGHRIADFNVTRVTRSSVQSNDIGIAAIEKPDEDEPSDMDFLASSDVVFFEFMGSPGALTYVRCLGFLSGRVEGSDWAHKRFTIEAPTHFLLAAGDFAAIADKMRLEKPATVRAPQAEAREKGPKQGAQEAGGERTEGEKGGGYVIVTRDGLRLQIRDKMNLQARRDQLEFMWRAAQYMAGSGRVVEIHGWVGVQAPGGGILESYSRGSGGSGTAYGLSLPKGKQGDTTKWDSDSKQLEDLRAVSEGGLR